MGLFDKFKKTNKLTWDESIRALKSDKISLQDFVNMNASQPLYYSTPAGENQEGKMTLWLIHNEKLNMSFYPAFLSEELCRETLSSAGRKNFIIIKGTLESVLSSLDINPVLEKSGLVIQGEDGNFAIPPQIRVQKR